MGGAFGDFDAFLEGQGAIGSLSLRTRERGIAGWWWWYWWRSQCVQNFHGFLMGFAKPKIHGLLHTSVLDMCLRCRLPVTSHYDTKFWCERFETNKYCLNKTSGIWGNVSHREARHPLEARHDPCSRWRYPFSKYLIPSAAYQVTNTIKKKRTTVRINLCALDQIFYLYLGGDN